MEISFGCWYSNKGKLTERKLREEITHNDFIFNDIIYFSQLFWMRECACVLGEKVILLKKIKTVVK